MQPCVYLQAALRRCPAYVNVDDVVGNETLVLSNIVRTWHAPGRGRRRAAHSSRRAQLVSGANGPAIPRFLLRAVWRWLLIPNRALADLGGSNDIRLWENFARRVDGEGLGATYVNDRMFNHPPMMGLLANTTLHISWMLSVPFSKTFKVWGLAAEFGIAFLLLAIWRRRGEPERAALAVAAYGCSLVCILISGFHGNLDPVYWVLVLAACYWLESRNAPFRAGLCLGASLEVKLIAMLVVLPLAATCRDVRGFVRFTAGVVLALTPFALSPLWFSSDEREAFVHNIFRYRSYTDNWGIEMLKRMVVGAFHDTAPAIARSAAEFGAHYHRAGANYLLAITTLIAVSQLRGKPRKLDAYSVAALCLCLFLVLASGFGVQYLGCVVPVLIAIDVGAGFGAATATGVFAALLYSGFIQSWSPLVTEHARMPASLAPASFLAWWVLLCCAIRICKLSGSNWQRLRPAGAAANDG